MCFILYRYFLPLEKVMTFYLNFATENFVTNLGEIGAVVLEKIFSS